MPGSRNSSAQVLKHAACVSCLQAHRHSRAVAEDVHRGVRRLELEQLLEPIAWRRERSLGQHEELRLRALALLTEMPGRSSQASNYGVEVKLEAEV